MIGAPDKNRKLNNLISFNSSFPSYLAGLWEGNGHVWIPIKEKSPSGKL
jgi:hypothetical protein